MLSDEQRQTLRAFPFRILRVALAILAGSLIWVLQYYEWEFDFIVFDRLVWDVARIASAPVVVAAAAAVVMYFFALGSAKRGWRMEAAAYFGVFITLFLTPAVEVVRAG
jgi:hypothetical protein